MKPGKAEVESFLSSGFTTQEFRRAHELKKIRSTSAEHAVRRIWVHPTFEVHGMVGGYTGPGVKTAIAPMAEAKVSMRLVPNQDPDKMADLFEAYVRKAAPKTVELTFTRMHGGKPWMTSFDNPFVQAAGRAIEKGFGQSPVYTREGGSIPVVSTFQEVLGLPSVLFGVGLPDENAHAPNEKLDVGNFHGGIISSAYLYDEISRIAR
jgi:acetylornithine deacetylase/succinyl-diaminopimelate desuccinylase-like protein